MKTIATILATLYLLFVSWQHDLGAQEGVQQPPQGSVVLKWLGNAGWEIQIGQTIILIDPFLTRGEANPNAEWKTDEAAVLKVIKRADYIFAGHSHADHIADVPFIAKKFGSKVIGSRTTTNIALTGGRGQITTRYHQRRRKARFQRIRRSGDRERARHTNNTRAQSEAEI